MGGQKEAKREAKEDRLEQERIRRTQEANGEQQQQRHAKSHPEATDEHEVQAGYREG